MNWYKDRDFPELKREIQGEPSEILAIIPNHEHLDAVVKAHNEEIEEILRLAEIWKKGYEDETMRLKRKIIELEQIVESLEEELRIKNYIQMHERES
jgi:predicted nuclease with TOPRIM domain